MSEVKVNKITPTADCGTVTLGDSGDTVAIASGVTLTSAGSITNSGTITNTGTISGGTITGTIDGQVNWQTTVKTSNFTASNGEGYFVNTTSGAITVTLPSSPSAGNIVGIKDYANTADTNNITIGRNGSNIQGAANDFIIDTEGLSIVLIYVDATKGWLSVGQSKAADISEQATFITATGGTVVTCGNFKTHIFTGPGTFCVSSIGNPNGGPNTVDYFVVAGGAANGAGGFRLSNVHNLPSPTTSPLANPSGIAVTAQGYPVSVGAGAAAPSIGGCSVFSTITSARGGKTADNGVSPSAHKDGGSGGAGGAYNLWSPKVQGGGSGNTPPVSPSQGNNGGTVSGIVNPSGSSIVFAGGGGAGAAAPAITVSNPSGAVSPNTDGAIGSYIADAFIGPTAPSYGTPGPVGSTRYFAGGGGGKSQRCAVQVDNGVGGAGGGAPNPLSSPTLNGVTNTGGGGGRSYPGTGGGGSGIVMIRYKYQ